MAKQMISFDEFSEIYNLMNAVPIKSGEAHNAYYKRLNACGTKRSRTTLQNIEQSKKDTDTVEQAYVRYKEITREINDKKKTNSVKKEPEQQAMVLPVVVPVEEEKTFEICGFVIEISIKTKGMNKNV